ncbi:MAG TPA: WhiB family transcriptional regulator [Acidimicrobiia bacterium]
MAKRRLWTLPLTADQEWRRAAACAQPAIDPEWFFGLDDNLTSLALDVCSTCTVTNECAAERDRIKAHGVWGGALVAPTKSVERARLTGKGAAV